jgi:hypothetical protein
MNDFLPLSQGTEYARALRGIGCPTTRLSDGTLVLHRKILGVPVALVSRYSMPTEALRNTLHAARLHRHVTLLTPENGPARGLRIHAPVTRALVDLRVDDLRARLHQKWRNRLNHSERQPLRIVRSNMPSDPGHWLFKADQSQQRARGYRNWPLRLTLSYIKENPGRAQLFTAYSGSEQMGAMLFLHHTRGATYHIGVQTSEGARLSSHNLLMWRAMKHLRHVGCPVLDLGTLSAATPGLNRFKLGTGAQEHQLGATYLTLPRLWPRPSPHLQEA